jgi:hypothetical protein
MVTTSPAASFSDPPLMEAARSSLVRWSCRPPVLLHHERRLAALDEEYVGLVGVILGFAGAFAMAR